MIKRFQDAQKIRPRRFGGRYLMDKGDKAGALNTFSRCDNMDEYITLRRHDHSVNIAGGFSAQLTVELCGS
jgi:hypothetical protein